jgi:hypothetical protein
MEASGAAARPRVRTAIRQDVRVEHRGNERARLIMGVFADLQKAGSAMLALEERGFTADDITLRITKENRDVIEGRRVFRDQRGRTYVARAPIPLRKVRPWRAGLGTGTLAGAVLGALLALAAGSAGTPAVLIFGTAFVARMVAAWALMGIMATAGALIGALWGLTKTEYRAIDYEGCRALEGAIVGVACHDDSEADAIERDLAAQGAEIVCAA